MSTSSSRIRWTEVEKIALAQATQGYLRIYPGTRIMKAFKAALEVLPEDRRRNIIAHAEVPWIDDYLLQVANDTEDRLFKNAAAHDRHPDESNVVAFQSPQATLSLDPTEQPAPVPQASHPPTFDLNSVPLEELTKAWLSRFFDEHLVPQIEKKADELIAKKMAAMLDQIQVERGEKGRIHVVVPTQVKKQMRPKVLVLGLLGQQITTIKQQYGQFLDLTLIGSDHKHDGLIRLAKSQDVGIVMTRFVNHAQCEQVKNNAPHYIQVSGATTDLGNILTSMISEGMEKVKQHNFSNKTFVN
jgi:hypothetical protein